ncbi:BspA family leucine-rich repeat surface protein [Lactobacillus sp. W8089]|nr:BspA family leucine-rich repeat surface protein [Lactobacillus sp. W8086]MBI0109474.1 BspA family leucine-rich repeat surface protein [Lactobacillus sp. W8085]MBI0112611.1 BspA family leucine-rich repeat surface protein [Lactobacillus sp. W8088]MBI0116327.1 BspA family leucine-rich repeat surface protein [Lactobacillus sp. W8087]MBI0120131.1 BspA family leucine-rich repeat surface protein [Lactobacillus sp. W8089]MBI0132096.1 BspA family leucine-rich repeat surface protein [Lactobacillus sp
MKKFVQIYHFLIRSLSAGQKFISLLLNYKVLSVQSGIVLGLLLINANYYACLNIKAATTSTLEEVINPSYLDMNSSTGSVQFNSPIKQVNTTSEIQVSAAPQLQQPNISPLLQVITVPSLLRSGSDYEKTEADQPTSGPGWSFKFDNGTLTLNSGLAEPKTKQNQDGSWTTIWPWDHLRPQVKSVDIQSEIKVTNTSSMFAQMPQLSTVNGLNNFTDKIEYMNAMFSGDSSLTSIDASQLKLDSVIQCAYMFDGCKQLESLNVSNWNVGNVKNFSSMFAGCTNLTSIKGLDTWGTTGAGLDKPTDIDMSSMFAYDTALKTLDLSNFDTSNVTTFKDMFASDIGLKSLNVSNFKIDKVNDFSNMFSSCKALTSITGLDTWGTTGAILDKPTDINMSLMFAYDDNLNTLDLSNFDTSNVTTFKDMFTSDIGLKSLNVSNFKTDKVNDFSNMFSSCKALKSITGLDTWKTTGAILDKPTDINMSLMFAYNDNLETLNLSKFDTSNVINFYAMFFYCKKLTSIAGLNNWKTKSATNMSSMFAGCQNLESITGLDNWDTTAATNMSSMFASATSLQKLDLSSFDTRNATQYNFFSGDTNLWYLKIGKNTQLKDDCGLPDPPKDKLFPSNQELPMKYKTSQNGKWQKGTNTVVDKTGAFCWWYPNDEMYTADEIKKYSQKDRDNGELFIWQPAFNQSKGSLVLTVSPSQINFDIILDTNNNILGNNNKSSYLAEANSDLEYTVQNPKGESWQLYAMMTKFKKKSNSDSEINSDAMSLSLNEGSENGKQHPLNQQPTSIRTSADNSLEWALKPVLNINIGGLNVIPKAGSSYTTTIDYDLVNSIQ